jgi:hypothetical protein
VASLALAGGALVLPACGGGERQDESEPEGEFPVAVTEASFPERQRISETAELRIAVENTGDEAVPDLATTISADPGAIGSFSTATAGSDLADPNRPVWILDAKSPRLAGETKPSGLSGATTAASNTYAFGPLEPDETKEMVWGLTAVRGGDYTVRYGIEAGLQGNAVAVDADGEPVRGTIPVSIDARAPTSRVNGKGQVVTQGP